MLKASSQCILCGHPERELLFQRGEWTIYRCSHCGLGFLDPRPDEEELKALYRKTYFNSYYDQGFKAGTPEMAKRIGQESHRIRFFRRFKQKGRILDIGCGMGYFLYACRQCGYEVQGVDISDDAAAYIREELKIPVTTGPIEAIQLSKESMDVITMWHFLEHAPDPRVYLEKAWQWLKPDGLLVVDVPNYEGTDAGKMWDTWTGWDPPYHLTHFTPHNLMEMLKHKGFQTLRTKDYLSEYVKEKLEKIPVVGLFARPVARMYSGHSFAVVARKTG